MNERIKEMWEEATVSVWPRPGKFTAGEYDHHLAKFAELIVRKCCQFENSYGGDAGLVARSYGRKIREHFGVE